MEFDFQIVDKIIEDKGSTKKSLIPLLQAIQDNYNYLPEPAIKYLSEKTAITAAEIISVASFYSQFRMEPVGEHMIKVCVGTACHVKGAMLVYDAFRRDLKLAEGEETDASKQYTLEKVSCLGCCTLAPVVQIDDVTYGHVSTDQVGEIISDFENQKNSTGKKTVSSSKRC